MIPAWQYLILEKIAHSGYANLSLVILKLNRGNVKGYRKGNFIYRIHHLTDRFIFSHSSDYSRITDARNLITEIPALKLQVFKRDLVEEFAEEDLVRIRKYNLDVILKLCFGKVGGEILNIPESGVWSYSMDNFLSEDNRLTGYYEIAKKEPVTASGLFVLRSTKEGNKMISVIRESTCNYSVHLNRDRLFRRASLIIPRILSEIHSSGNAHLKILEGRYNLTGEEPEADLQTPSLLPAMVNLTGSLVVMLRQTWKKLVYSDPFSWVLLFNIGGNRSFQDIDYAKFRELKPPKDRFWADPFVVSNGEKYHVFVEEYIYRSNKGHIALLEIGTDGTLLSVKKVIKNHYHMSYPFVFKHRDDYFMIPETGENRTVDLYRSTDFPEKWILLKPLMTGINAVDTTLFYHNSKWWLFTVIDKIECKLDNSPELYLFYSDDFLSGNWISHPLNPVVTDVRNSRPAGRVFPQDGKIYRPSQDCSGRYGQAFTINEVITLSETDYVERPLLKVTPDWNKDLKGTHTFNFDNGFTIIDAYTFRKRSENI